MRIALLFLICISSFLKLHAQQSLWKKVDKISYTTLLKTKQPEKFALSKINIAQLKSFLSYAPLENEDGKLTKGLPFSMPLPNESTLSTSVFESPVWEDKYADQFTNIKTYILSDPLTNSLQGRITLTPQGISGIMFSDNGIVYIHPLNNDEETYISYYADKEEVLMLPCGSKSDLLSQISSEVKKPSGVLSAYAGRRTYRLAVAATGEYTTWAGGQTNALSYITISINNVMAIYERDLNIRFTIVAPNSILFTNAATDPYPGNAYLDDVATNANQTTLDNIIGTANYDLGIVFNYGWDRGYVPLPFGFTCKAASKGKGAAGYSAGVGLNTTKGPQGLVFDFTVAHELGHTFGASHTFASNAGFCGPYGTASTAYEPGAGSSLMTYATYTDCGSYVNYIEPYFHAGSIAQIQSYLNNNTCAQTIPTANRVPKLSVAATSYNVPVSTPFTLTANGTDEDGNTLVYNWEQMDAAFTVTPPPANNAAGPNFRSYPPTKSGNVRTFPRLQDIAAGISPLYEVLPSITRTMNFRVTARDQSISGPATVNANIALNFKSNAGPFIITSQQSAETWTTGSTKNITWNVAGTNAGTINCTAVDILFSVDGGFTYPYTLASNTANDGSETITVPNLSTKAGRIRIQSVSNVFFNINKANITISSSCFAEGARLSSADSVFAPAGSASLNLTLTPQYGIAFSPSGTITGSGSTFLPIYNLSGPYCAVFEYEGTFRYAAHPFVVTEPGSYTFTRASGANLVYNLYYESFDPAFPCNNFIASNTSYGTSTPTSIKASVSANLSPGYRYVLVAGTFSKSTPLPANYSVTVSGGSIYTDMPNPGASFNYLYVVVDEATNLIKAISNTADLSNSTTFPGGTGFIIYGLSYSNSSPSLNSFVGSNFSTLKNALLYNASYCGNLSKNYKRATVLAVYTFTGNGNWNVAANWSNNSIPPSPLPKYSEIIINPAGNGQCILNVPMTIPKGDKITVQAGKKFSVSGNLTILD